MGPNGAKYEKFVRKGANIAADQLTKQQFKEPKEVKGGNGKPQQGELQQGKSFPSHLLSVWVVDDGWVG